MSIHPVDHFKQNILPWARLGIVLAALLWLNVMPGIYGDRLGTQSLTLADSGASALTTYKFDFTLITAGQLGSITIAFCANDPEIGNPCVTAPGLDITTATLSSQSPTSDFTISPASNATTLVLTRPASAAAAEPFSLTFDNITNPSTPGSYFARIQTFASDDATGTASDFGGVAFAITNEVTLTATVPPYLIFCTAITIPNYNCADASGDFLNFGELSSTSTRSGTSQMLAATNAELGYSVTLAGSTMASGTNFIAAIATDDVSRPGTAQFGMNLRANAAPSVGANPSGPGLAVPMLAYNQPNLYQFASGDIVVSNDTTDDARRFTSSYIVNVPAAQAAGIYVSTITYICLANF